MLSPARSTFDIPGWIDEEEAQVFAALLSSQTSRGVHGDILEVGVYHGRSAAVEATYLQPGEKLVLLDTFAYASTDDVWANISRVLPDLECDSVEFWAMTSQDPSFPMREFRFAYIDGGHSTAEVLADLRTFGPMLMAEGILVVDDYGGRQWPGVTEGVDEFLADGEFGVIVDMDSSGGGRKLYMVRR